MQDQQIAGMQAQRGCHAAVRKHIAISGRAIGLTEIVDAEIHFQDAVLAAEIPWLGNGAAGCGSNARIVRGAY